MRSALATPDASTGGWATDTPLDDRGTFTNLAARDADERLRQSIGRLLRAAQLGRERAPMVRSASLSTRPEPDRMAARADHEPGSDCSQAELLSLRGGRNAAQPHHVSSWPTAAGLLWARPAVTQRYGQGRRRRIRPQWASVSNLARPLETLVFYEPRSDTVEPRHGHVRACGPLPSRVRRGRTFAKLAIEAQPRGGGMVGLVVRTEMP